MIREDEHPILDAFLKRELSDYQWCLDGLELIRQSILFAYWKDVITSCPMKGNYVTVNSMTNMGMVNRSVTFSVVNWDFKAGNISMHLGSTPRDPVCITRGKLDSIVDMTAHLN